MLHLRITGPATVTAEAVRLLEADPAVTNLVHLPGAALRPAGDLVLADVVREAATRPTSGRSSSRSSPRPRASSP